VQQIKGELDPKKRMAMIVEAFKTPMATSNSPTYGRPNSPGQDALIIS